jgi:hypothetical protein
MFDSVRARFALRAVLVGVAASNAAFLTALYAGQAISSTFVAILVSVGVAHSLAYAGIGAAVPSVEPSIGHTPDAPPPAE